MAKTKTQRWQEKFEFFAQDYNDIWSAAQMERRQAVADRRFYSILGAQYEDALGDQFENTPRFEYNKVHQSVIRIFNEYRNNRISVVFQPDDAASDADTAETLTGRYRADEQKCNAQEAYDNSFEEAVGGGMGAFKFRCVADVDESEDEQEYEDGDDIPLRCIMEPIFDADTSVYFDLDAKRQDKRDAKRCFVIYSISRRAYEKQYPQFDTASFQKPTDSRYFDWCTPDVIYIADVYEVETKGAKKYVYQSRVLPDAEEITLEQEEQDKPQEVADLEAQGYFLAREERITRRQIHKWQMNGCEIMKDCGVIPGRWIPIIPVYGKRWYVDNIERFMGQVRLQKDMQRLLNMMISWLAEIASLSPMEIPVLTPEQIAGHADGWANGNITRKPYRLVNALKDAAGNKLPPTALPTLTPPVVPPVMAALMQVCIAAMDQLGGGAPAGEEDVASNISGKAVELIQTRIDMQSFIFTDNFGKAMKQAGVVWLSIQKDIMPEGQHKAPIVKPDGTRDFADMAQPKMKDGVMSTTNDPRAGRYGVTVDVGPSFISRRNATVRALMGMLQLIGATDPQEASVLAAAIIMNMDGEGLEDLRKYYRRKLVSMGAVEPTDEEKAELEKAQQNQKPDPNAEFLVAEAKKSLALAEKAIADAAVSRAKVPNVQADTALKDEQANKTGADAQLAVHAALNPPPQKGAPGVKAKEPATA